MSSRCLGILWTDSYLAVGSNHIQQFKEISQGSEEALASLNATHDEYKSTTEAQLTASCMLSPFVFLFHEHSLLVCRPSMMPFGARCRMSNKNSCKQEQCASSTHGQSLLAGCPYSPSRGFIRRPALRG